MVYLEMEQGLCTGVKIGEHTILTAQHCFDLGGKLTQVNDRKCGGGILYRDGNDHVIVRTFCPVPGKAAKVGKVPPIGTEVYLWGNPIGMRSMLRVGKVAGELNDGECTPCIVFDINVWQGDSGGAYFDSTGKIVAIVYGYWGDRTRLWRLGISKPITFTKKQLGDNE